MRRSILAIGTGYVVSALGILAVTLLSVQLFTDVPLANRAEAARSLGTGWYVFEFAYALPIGGLGGYLAAWLAGRRPLAHAAGLAAVFGAMGITSVLWSAGFKPAVHDVAVTFIGIAGCLAGGWLRERQVNGKTGF